MSLTYWVCCAGWLAGWWALGRPTPLAPVDPSPDRRRDRRPDRRPGAPGSTTIVVPARNETASLGGLLSDLRREAIDDERLRVVVVDDSSEDDTAAIARRSPGVELLEAPPLPPGWAGKCWAVDRGVAATGLSADSAPAEDDLLVLIDADVRLHPDSLEALREEHRRSGGLVSVQPWHDTLRPYEQLSALFNVIALMGTGAGSAAPTGAFGPVLATTRADYHAVGGHESVCDEVVEDLALARRYRDAGRPVTVRTGGALISFRMYPTGLADLVDGWTKNFALGAGATPLPRLAAIVLWISALGSASVAVVDAARGRTDVVLAVTAYLLVAAQLGVMFRRVGRFGWVTALLHPVLVSCFVAVFVRSLWRTHVRHNVEWRGRTIETSPRRS